MGKISDEIRSFVKRSYEDEHMDPRELLAIADRADRETVELPRDRDWVPIHVGDTVYLKDGRKYHVSRVNLARDHTSIDVTPWGTGRLFFSIEPTLFTHSSPDSWERIADELDEQAGSLTKDGYTWQEDAIHDFADRIRKLAEKEGK